MRKAHRNRSWFAQLRRDRLLFAVVSIFLVFAATLEPLAAAQSVPADRIGTICRLLAADDAVPSPLPSERSSHEDCAHCVAGPCAGLALAARADLAETVIRLPAGDAAHAAPRVNRVPRALAGEPPPAIRAPPALV
jgi:hypothetical protein